MTTLLVAAMFVAITGDVHISQHDLDGKRAYSAAEAGANAFLYQLNQNPTTGRAARTTRWPRPRCRERHVTVQRVLLLPGDPGERQHGSCTTNSITSLIDNATGSLRMEFTGYSGGPNSVVRTLVASYRKLSPLDFLWYTVYEALDSSINGYSDCGVFYRAGRNSNCNINWVTGDVMNGPMYTQDQYLIDGSPTFGRGPDRQDREPRPGDQRQRRLLGEQLRERDVQRNAGLERAARAASQQQLAAADRRDELRQGVHRNDHDHVSTGRRATRHELPDEQLHDDERRSDAVPDHLRQPTARAARRPPYDPFTATYPTSGAPATCTCPAPTPPR